MVATFEPNFEPLVPVDTVGTVKRVYEEGELSNPLDVGYDVTVTTTEGTVEEFFFYEFELTEAEAN
jgi:hypothetical protein